MNRWLFAVMLLVAATSLVGSGQGVELPRSSGWLVQERDGTLLVASGAHIPQKPGQVDKIGSFLLGLGYGAPGYDSAALALMRYTPQGAADARFGNAGSVVTPLLPLKNRDSATVTALLEDSAGRPIVVGWRYQWTFMDSSVLVIFAARYTTSGALDTSFGDRGVVTTRIGKAFATQAFAAAMDDQGRLLVAGYSGGNKVKNSIFDDWSVNAVLLRYTPAGKLDASFGNGGVASQKIDPTGKDKRSGRDFMLYNNKHTAAAGLVIDRQGRAVVAASNGEAPALLLRYAPDGKLDPTFGNAGTASVAVDAGFSISTLMQDSEGRLAAAGTAGDRMTLVRYSQDGAMDSAFGVSGVSSISIGAGMRVSAALQDREGRLLAVASGDNGVHLARFDRNGIPDKSFGSEGVIRSAPGTKLSTDAGLTIDAAGIPVVATVSGDKIVLTRFD